MAKQVKVKKDEIVKEESNFIPDIPAQMESDYERSKNLDMSEFKDYETLNISEPYFEIKKEEKPDSDEILFLKHLLHRQHIGGFGRHLDDEINERIKHLKTCL